MADTTTDPLSLSSPQMRLIWGLVALCCVAESLLLLGDADIIQQVRLRSTVYENGAFWPGLWRDWRPNYIVQPYTMFVTYAFLHGNLTHLALNMITLVSLGRGVVERVGNRRFLAIYAASATGGAGTYAFLSSSGAPMVGASGALFGLAGALLAWIWEDSPTLRDSLASVGKVVALLIAINVVMYVGLDGRLAWETHLGGFIAGWIAGIALDRSDAPQ